MNFYILRHGNKLGPFPDSAVEDMAAQGELRAGDLVCLEGEHNWLPVGQYREACARRAAAPVEGTSEVTTAAPQPLPPAATPSKTAFLHRSALELDDSTLTAAEREVIAGGRFVTYRYCWSLLLSFKPTSRPVLLRTGDDGFGPALRYSLLSLVLGWWGIPGPIWAISTMRHNAQGGRDVTLETLTHQVGNARAAAACARRQDSVPPGAAMRALGGMLGAMSLALLLGLGWVGWAFAHGEIGEPAPGPGSKEFAAADQRLVEAKRSSIFGNVPKALELADAFNKGAQEAYLALVRQQPGVETNGVAIATFCEGHQDRVIFLLQVPGLQKLPASVRKQFADAAWRTSSLVLTDLKAGFADLRVAVGIRSAGKYDQVLTGRYVRDFEANNTGLRSRAEGPRSKAKLYPLFIPVEQLESWKDE